MFDEILGPRKKKNDIVVLDPYFKVKLGVKLDEATATGKIYVKEIFKKALEKAIAKPTKLLITMHTPNSNSTINLTDIIGVCKGYEMQGENQIIFHVNSIKGFDFNEFDLFPAGLGTMTTNYEITDDYYLLCLTLPPASNGGKGGKNVRSPKVLANKP